MILCKPWQYKGLGLKCWIFIHKSVFSCILNDYKGFNCIYRYIPLCPPDTHISDKLTYIFKALFHSVKKELRVTEYLRNKAGFLSFLFVKSIHKLQNTYYCYNSPKLRRPLAGTGIFSSASYRCPSSAILIGWFRMTALPHMPRSAVITECKLSCTYTAQCTFYRVLWAGRQV